MGVSRSTRVGLSSSTGSGSAVQQGGQGGGTGRAGLAEAAPGEGGAGRGVDSGWLGWMKSASGAAPSALEGAVEGHGQQEQQSVGAVQPQGWGGGWRKDGSQDRQPGQEQGEEGEEEEMDSEQELAESLLALGVKHKTLPDGTVEFMFDRYVQPIRAGWRLGREGGSCPADHVLQRCGGEHAKQWPGGLQNVQFLAPVSMHLAPLSERLVEVGCEQVEPLVVSHAVPCDKTRLRGHA